MTVISVENISKLYRLGQVGTGTLSHDLNRWWHKVRGKEDPYLKIGQAPSFASNASRRMPSIASAKEGLCPTMKATDGKPGAELDAPSDYVWALKDVSFEVKQGEVLGIIGRNGAGKSTLLKILSRVTAPTTGQIKVKGRIASLLEVGTGFHPELTGRENIYLNGAILGMRKREINRKFDEIVAFAEVERYIDTPVKRYSSGMYVRLAFAVAAHLDPEVLVVDEVLAVGDAAFQAKCLGKMQDVSTKQGRTVLFVSHNLAAVRQLCANGLLLVNGQLVVDGKANAVADRYLQSMLGSSRERIPIQDTGYTRVQVVNSDGMPVTSVVPDQETFVEIALRVSCGSDVQCGFTIYNQLDVPLVLCASEYGGVQLHRGEQTFYVRLPNELMQPGTYRIEGAVWDPRNVYHQDDCLCIFQVMPARQHEMHGRSSAAQFVARERWITASDRRPALLAMPQNVSS